MEKTTTNRSNDALIALRQIQRRTEQASKQLASKANLTPSQLLVLQILEERGEVSAGEVAALTKLKHATITSLVDKLEARALISRRRSSKDRRRVWLSLQPEGQKVVSNAPNLLQDSFQNRFNNLPDWHQSMMVAALEHVVTMLDAEDMDAAPILDIGALDENPE